MSTRIHPAAIVHESAQFGEGVEIAAGAVIGENVVLGDGCKVMNGAFLENVTMGKRNMVFPYAVIGTAPQDTKFRGEKSGVEFGNDNIVREFATINRASGEGEKTVVGNRCFLLITCHIGHNTRLGNGVVLTNQVSLGGHMELGDGVIFGGMSGGHQFVRVGRLAMIGGYSALLQNAPPFMLVKGGYRAGIYRLNAVGCKRAGISDESIALLEQALAGPMRRLNDGKPDLGKLVEEILALGQTAEVQELADFFKQETNRGFCEVIDKEVIQNARIEGEQ